MQPKPCGSPEAGHDQIPVYHDQIAVYTCICEMRKEEKRLEEVGVSAFLMGFSRGKDVPITGFPHDSQLNEWAHQAVNEILREKGV